MNVSLESEMQWYQSEIVGLEEKISKMLKSRFFSQTNEQASFRTTNILETAKQPHFTT